MACAQSVSLCFVAGDTITIDWQYTEQDDLTPIDLTGATAQMQLLDNITDQTEVIDMTGGITDATGGKGRFSLTNVESQSLLPVATGDNPASKKFTSRIKLTYSDTTTKTIAGVDVTIEQGGIR